MKVLINILLWIWQLPQHLLGLFLILIFNGKKKENYYFIKSPEWWQFGVSLGNYILFSEAYINYFDMYPEYETETILHEKGHSVQSKIFGPLYLIIIGFASAICNNLWDRLFHKSWSGHKRYLWYYNRWPENWADKISGIKRQ